MIFFLHSISSSAAVGEPRRWKIMRVPHFKILGWLWLVFGLFWSLLIAWALLTGASITPRPQPGVTYSIGAWWEEVIGNTLECSFFFASTLLGLSLLRRWRWAQSSLGILGAILLAVWVLCIVSPSVPPMTHGMNFLFLSPLLALALYSLMAVLVPSSQAHLSRKSKVLISAGAVFGILFAIGFHIVAFHNVPPNPAEAQVLWDANMAAFRNLQYDRIRPAAEAFAKDRKAHGLAVPNSVSFKQLASQGYLSLSEVAPFSNADATVSFKAAEAGSSVPWIRIRWKDGAEISVPYVKPAQ